MNYFSFSITPYFIGKSLLLSTLYILSHVMTREQDSSPEFF